MVLDTICSSFDAFTALYKLFVLIVLLLGKVFSNISDSRNILQTLL